MTFELELTGKLEISYCQALAIVDINERMCVRMLTYRYMYIIVSICPYIAICSIPLSLVPACMRREMEHWLHSVIDTLMYM